MYTLVSFQIWVFGVPLTTKETEYCIYPTHTTFSQNTNTHTHTKEWKMHRRWLYLWCNNLLHIHTELCHPSDTIPSYYINHLLLDWKQKIRLVVRTSFCWVLIFLDLILSVLTLFLPAPFLIAFPFLDYWLRFIEKSPNCRLFRWRVTKLEL